MKSAGWTRGLALLTVFAIGCSDMTTNPLPLFEFVRVKHTR
jgi:hypothetical protein